MMRVRVAVAVSFALLPAACAHSSSPLANQNTTTQRVPREGYLPGADGARIFYRVLGNGPDTIVAVHGGPGAGMNAVLPELEPLAERHTVIFYDQRGGGRSEMPADTALLGARYYVEDLDAVRQFFGLARMSLIAHSFGAVLVARYAQEHPERVERMIFFGAVPPRRSDGAKLAERSSTALAPELQGRISRLMPKFAAIDTISDPVAVCREYEDIGRQMAIARGEPTRWRGTKCAMPPEAMCYYIRYTTRLGPAAFGEWDFTESLSHVGAPLLVIYDDRDPRAAELQKGSAAAVPEGRLLLIRGAGKGASADRPEIFSPAVEAFLAGNWPVSAEAVSRE